MPSTVTPAQHAPETSNLQVDVGKFKREGFVIFPGLMSKQDCDPLKSEIDLAASGNEKVPVLREGFSNLLLHPHVVRITSALMEGSRYAFHHLHAECQRAGTKGLGWHHDYEQYPSRDRKYTMIHVFVYLNGLHGTIGDLLLLPGSQNEVVDRYYYSDRSLDSFDNTVVLNHLPPGSVVAIHSALIHARRAQPGGEELPRYFIDMSFCQEGTRWPPYLENGDWRHILRTLNARHESRFGKGAFMFDERNFRYRLKDRIIDRLGVRGRVNAARTYLSGDRHKRLM
jgi:ectoine hydroxylase-related dioxygenase (phytanoyl-CoA dioxygenase family)